LFFYLFFFLEHGFQFLIGTVKTQQITRYFDLVLYVSIPHRYCKNETP